MSEHDQTNERVDGRVARRERNIGSVLDIVIEMFVEDAMFPSMEQVASRSGLSLRSLYRYFADPHALREAAIARNFELARSMSKLRAIGEGPLDRRIDDFVAMRVGLHRALAAVFRASAANRHLPVVGEVQARNRAMMREQFELQFAPELSVMSGERQTMTIAAGDLLLQIESIEFLRSGRSFSEAKTRNVLVMSLASLLAP